MDCLIATEVVATWKGGIWGLNPGPALTQQGARAGYLLASSLGIRSPGPRARQRRSEYIWLGKWKSPMQYSISLERRNPGFFHSGISRPVFGSCLPERKMNMHFFLDYGPLLLKEYLDPKRSATTGLGDPRRSIRADPFLK